MVGTDEKRQRESDELYARYAKPLEDQHRGEYVAISPEGKTVVGRTLLEVAQAAKASFGPGSFIFKVGERVVGRWR